MISISNILLTELLSDDQYNKGILKTSGNKPIVDAIKNRKKITFYYSGPRKPKKDSVKAGYRVKVEPVALGLSKKGNLIIRAWVDTPSTTKSGFGKGHWRTFILVRANNIQVTDEVFNEKRPGYKEGNDNSMTVTYVSTDWSKQPETKKVEKPKPTKNVSISKPEPEVKPTAQTEPEKTEPTTQNLPQPKPEVKPELTPQNTTVQNNKEKELYDKKKSEWVSKQKEVGGNVSPGQGTRERFKKEVGKELEQPKPEEKPSVNPEEKEEDNKLQESIKKIKHLMFS
jgi:hypothetical protein